MAVGQEANEHELQQLVLADDRQLHLAEDGVGPAAHRIEGHRFGQFVRS